MDGAEDQGAPREDQEKAEKDTSKGGRKMRRDRRFQLLFNRDRVALILDCLEQARRTFRASGEKSEEELAEIEKLEHSFRQVLAYDETFKEFFNGGGK